MPRLLWLSARWLRNVGDGGVGRGQLPPDRQRPAVLGLRLRRPARLAQQDADAVDRVRQVAPGLGRRPGGGGQRLLVGPRQPVGRQRLGILADRGQEAAQPRPAGRQRRPAPPATRSPGRPAAPRPRGRSPAPRRSCRSPPAARRPPSGCGRPRPSPPRRPPARPPAPRRAASTARCAASASSLRPTFAGQLGQLEVRRRQRPPRGRRPSPGPAGAPSLP